MTVPRPEPIRVGIVGVGNCASSFVQGLHHYRGVATDGAVPGLISPELGGYRIDDIAIASAFDVSAEKVGQDVARAIHARPNNTHVFAEVPSSAGRPSTASAATCRGSSRNPRRRSPTSSRN